MHPASPFRTQLNDLRTTMKLRPLIADLRLQVQLLDQGIHDEEQRTGIFDVADVTYQMLAQPVAYLGGRNSRELSRRSIRAAVSAGRALRKSSSRSIVGGMPRASGAGVLQPHQAVLLDGVCAALCQSQF
jgi:hypothetical protein